MMGSRVRGVEPEDALARWIPAMTLLSMGIVDWSRGSGRPKEIWVFLTTAMYDLAVCGARPWSARNAAKQQRRCSFTGKGEDTLNWVQNASKRLIAAL